MAYSELIKNFRKIRDYMREFYIYGFKSREEYNINSARSYDDERRRIESWLGDYMGFRQTPEGKNVFISIDSRVSRHNPLYRAWKAKSFTDGDITLYFAVFDILSSPEIRKSVTRITEELDRKYLSVFSNPKLFDESTVRKKLKEYVADGMLKAEKQGKTVLYSRTETAEPDYTDALDFFSEVAPCGVIGSYLLDRLDAHEDHFAFKHHYIAQALDSEILLKLFDAMREKQEVVIANLGRGARKAADLTVLPLRILCSVQNGRQYLLAYQRSSRRIKSFRIDYIQAVKQAGPADDFDYWRAKLKGMEDHMWGVSTQGESGRMEHVEFTVRFDADEEHIVNRLLREKRCGTVERIDETHCRYTADVYDASEMLPWIRTFICRITELNISNKETENRFRNDLEEMARLYSPEGGAGE